MKKQNLIINLFLVAIVLFGMAFKCGNNGNGGNTTNPKDESATGGFEQGHHLEGRYKKRDSFEYFTFSSDGGLKTSVASAGDFRGGDYAVGGEKSGTYELSGNTLTVELDNGNSKDYRVEIYRCCETPDYSETSPPVLKIGGVFYDNVD